MASRIVQYFADKLKTIKEYPITLTKAVYDENGKRLDDILEEIDASSDYKFLGDFLGAVDVNLPTDFKELFIRCSWATNTAQNFTFSIPKVMWDKGANYGYVHTGTTTAICSLYFQVGKIRLENINIENRGNVASTSHMYIWYR